MLRSLLFIILCSSSVFAQQNFSEDLAKAAYGLTQDQVVYDPRYFVIPYPNGDVPAGLGVCTDVVIRAYRKLGIDLQELVHQDMLAHFNLYPQRWGLKRPDSNIDHRRVPNLMCYFRRFGIELPKSKSGSDYQPGDIVCWDLGSGILHIGLVSQYHGGSGNPLIVHNIGGGQVIEDMLFDYTIIGYFRFEPKE